MSVQTGVGRLLIQENDLLSHLHLPLSLGKTGKCSMELRRMGDDLIKAQNSKTDG